MPSPAPRRDRLQLRISARTKRRLARAAAYEQKTVTEFLLESASAEADRIIERHENLVLPPADWEAFHDALLNPPKPNANLRRAVRWYRELSK
jgi:uncharacterized protein (DUF1778 family)